MLQTILQLVTDYHQGFLAGLLVTVELFAIVLIVGIGLGTALGWCSAKYPSVALPVKILSFILSGVPILVFLMWMHYPFQEMLGIVVDPFYTAALTFSVINVFAVADIVRKQILDFPQQYLTAAKVSGLSTWQTIKKIEFPLLFRQLIPSLILLQVVMLHTTLFASIISVEEIFNVTQRINSSVYKPVELYTALGIFFLIISLPLNGFAYWLQRRFTRNISEK